MTNFLQFIKKPIYPSEFVKMDWGVFFLLLFVFFVFALPFAGIGIITLKLTGIARIPLELTLFKKVLFGIFLAPIYEEVLLRLLLVFSKKNIAIFISCCALLLIYFCIKSSPKFFIFSLLIIATSILYLYHNQCCAFINNHYKLFFYLSALLFGLIHIFNFTGITSYNLIFTPLLVLPQIFMGFILAYIRVNYGFKYGVLFHSIVNISILLT